MKFADVIVDISAERLDRKFQYRIPIMLDGERLRDPCDGQTGL